MANALPGAMRSDDRQEPESEGRTIEQIEQFWTGESARGSANRLQRQPRLA